MQYGHHITDVNIDCRHFFDSSDFLHHLAYSRILQCIVFDPSAIVSKTVPDQQSRLHVIVAVADV